VLLGSRTFSAPNVRDFFDLADALLAESSIASALALVPRTALARLAQGDVQPSDDLLLRLGLATGSPETAIVAMDEVTQAARALCAQLNVTAQDIAPAESESLVADAAADTAKQEIAKQETAGIERGLALTTAIDDLVSAILARPARRMSTGQLAAADNARLSGTVEHIGMPIARAIDLAESSGLISLVDGWWMTTPAFDEWRAGSPAQRWVDLVFGWRNALDSRVVEILKGRSLWTAELVDYTRWLFPLESQWIVDLVTLATNDAELLGLVSRGTRHETARAVLEPDTALARENVLARATTALPEPVNVVYVQNDLTIVAPGMLRGETEQLLRRICDVEHSGLASTFRLSVSRISTALANGMTAAHIIEELQALSATPLPQPVVYLIEDTGARFGAIRVRPWGNGSLVTCRDAALLELLLADSSLSTLTWGRVSDSTATTRHDPVTTLEMLVSEKHPAVLEDDEGNLDASPRVVQMPIAAKTPVVPVLHALVDRLIASTSTETGSISHLDDATAWRERQISLAIRDKSTLLLTFDMPDGTQKSLTVIPLSLANGRLRAKDMVTEVERTLPMASISALATPESVGKV
jgi:hypothetical protein